GLAALNATPSFVDRGVRKRAILSCGKQDLDMDLTPMDEGAILLGGSSDHLLVDVTDVKANVRAGSLLSFKMGYSAIMRAFTSKYVDKEYLHG
ncbi:MAG: alanine/ornithine racemase family PLP-dependent enzyme, partial [Eubacteriaceae bacterium]|nr:alanine/ornithine racemase family PLP-dependent enzyme [Eubacteriaceae bacterium]